MGGKNRSKKKEGLGSSSSTKKSASVKVGNKQANKRARAQGQKESESSRSKNALDKRAVKMANKASGSKKPRANDGENAESRKKAKRKNKGGATGAPSVKQMRQHAHEARAMSRHDEDFNDRAQAKADRKAGKLSAKEESERLAREEEMREPEANAADLRYFEKNQQLAGFLQNLNEDDLKWTKEDRTKPKPKFPTQAPGKKKLSDMSDEDEEDDDDEDDDDEDDDDDDEDDDEEEDDDDDEDDEPAPSSKKKTSLEALERGGARKPSWAAESKTQKDRLPIRNADGSWGVSEIAKHDALRARAEALEKLQKTQEEMEARKARIEAGEEEDEEAEIDEEADASEQDEDEDAEMEDAEDDKDKAEEGEDEEEDEEMSDFDDEIPNDSDLEAELAAEEAMEQDLGEEEQEDSESMKEKQARRQYRLKCELAENSESILENPEKNIGKLEPMLQLCQDSDLTVQQYALMSCVEVLVDLMPAYRIRMPTEEEEAKNLSKETKTTWKFERSYLLYYGRLINLIMSYTKKIFNPQTNDRTDISAFGMNLLRCGSRLLEKGYAFNYRKELINLISPFLNHVAAKIRTLVFQTLVAIFRSDIAGESTLEITRILTRIVKEKGRRANVEVLQIFLYLPLHKEILQADTGDDKKKPEPKKKKFQHIRIDEAEFAKDQAESEAVVSVATRKKIQTQLLTELFTAYFRVLKQDKNSKLLPTVLKGLSKFASLIDIEIVLDLLDCLKATINPENEDPLSLESSLYVILTSFTTLKSHGQALNLDLKEFYNCLYGLLLDFANTGDADQIAHLPLLLQCLQLMFHETKQLSVDRVASFIKRLSTLCLYTPPYAALSLLHAIRLCLNKYPKAKALLDREATASGVHLAEIDDPDLVNPFASTAWELGLMKAHYHPFLPVYAASILDDENLPLSLARMSPQALFENYDTSEGGFNPPLPLPALFAGGAANPASTSATMKKKLDLKRRILMQQLAATVKHGRFQSDFLKKLTARSQNTKPASSMNHEELKKRLEKLRQLRAQAKKARVASANGNNSSNATATASNNKSNPKKRSQPSSASAPASNKKSNHHESSNSAQPQKKQKVKH